ncbi:hypothetical protein [Paractinoplanes durhamensis]|uniref:hypothetical protein n=1 Tax=Paractinoplanes durhamensis TaxID=113563 RepID=UPI00362C31DB
MRYAPLAAPNATFAAATTADTTSSWAKLNRPSAYATGIVIITANRARSMPIITGRLGRNSTHGPSGNASSAPTAGPTADSAATSAGVACSTSTAISGSAPKPKPEP